MFRLDLFVGYDTQHHEERPDQKFADPARLHLLPQRWQERLVCESRYSQPVSQMISPNVFPVKPPHVDHKTTATPSALTLCTIYICCSGKGQGREGNELEVPTCSSDSFLHA
eukprot:764504-Hanusia_phi.AAC.6